MSYIENVCGWHERENVSIGKFDGQNVSIVNLMDKMIRALDKDGRL